MNAITLVLLLAGLVLLVLGARWLVGGAVSIARWAGLSELIIGLTTVAAGTSLPEVAASVIAAIRNERDIAVGNVVGSKSSTSRRSSASQRSSPPEGWPSPRRPWRLTFR